MNWIRHLASILLLAGAVAQSGCDGSLDGPSPDIDYSRVSDSKVIGPAGGSADPDGGAPVSMTLSGRVTFERLATNASGLDTVPTVENARFVAIEVVAHDEFTTALATTTTDGNGDYTVNFNTDVDVYVRARAESGAAPEIDRVFHVRSKSSVIHAIPSPILHRSTPTQTVDLAALHTGSLERAGAFAILDTVQRLRAAGPASIGTLDIFWAARNLGGPAQEGFIPGSSATVNGPFGNPALFLAGGLFWFVESSGNHDEYDETVIARHWATFLLRTQSRDNDFEGDHTDHELLPNAAYSQGVAIALGCAMLGMPTYRDTLGFPGALMSVKREFDCESGTVPGTGVGYGSQYAVAKVVWDLLDGGAGWPVDADADPVAIDAADFFTSFAALRTRSAPYQVAWLASLQQQLVDDGFLTVADADALMQAEGAQFPPAGPAFPQVITLGAAATPGTLDAFSSADVNTQLGPQANAVYQLDIAIPQAVTITLSSTASPYDVHRHKLHFHVYDLQGNLLAEADGNSAIKTKLVFLAAGTFIVRVLHLPSDGSQNTVSPFTVRAQ